MRRLCAFGAVLGLVLYPLHALAGSLIIYSNPSDPSPRKAWEEVVAAYEQQQSIYLDPAASATQNEA